MQTSELWMKLEALAHLRGLPQYGAIKKAVEAELAEHNDTLANPPEQKPRAVPSAAVPSAEVDRRL